jgi:hypothetical protein
MKTIAVWAIGLGLAALLSSGAHGQTKDCQFPRFRTMANQEVALPITVRSGKRCHIKLGTTRGPVFGARVLSSPGAGQAAAVGTSMIYTARAGYTGADSFKWAWVGHDRYGNNTMWPVAVAVTVVP